jgi:hypothetical protein
MLGITMASVSALPAYTKEVTERPDSSRLATYFDLFSALLWPGGTLRPWFFNFSAQPKRDTNLVQMKGNSMT